VWRAAVGDAVPIPEIRPDGVADLFHHLLGVNADGDNLPPALAFAEEVAAHCDTLLASKIRDRIDQLAHQLQLVETLRRHRDRSGPLRRAALQAAPTGPIRPCLLIQIERDGIDEHACKVKYWIQRRSDSWDPEPGEPRRTTFQRVERVMQEAIRHAESLWRDGAAGPFEIELLLPTDLLREAVEWWDTDLEGPVPTPLCLDYPVVVRSLDRMRADFRHRVWTDRWKALWRPPTRHRLYWGRTSPGDRLDHWHARLRADTTITTVPLGTSATAAEGDAELRLALNAGVPVILWDRRVPLDAEAIRLIERLAEDEPDLLRQRLAELRRAAATSDDQPRHPGRHLALLWDDPERTVYEGHSS
jgi:hypothetical protein